MYVWQLSITLSWVAQSQDLVEPQVIHIAIAMHSAGCGAVQHMVMVVDTFVATHPPLLRSGAIHFSADHLLIILHSPCHHNLVTFETRIHKHGHNGLLSFEIQWWQPLPTLSDRVAHTKPYKLSLQCTKCVAKQTPSCRAQTPPCLALFHREVW